MPYALFTLFILAIVVLDKIDAHLKKQNAVLPVKGRIDQNLIIFLKHELMYIDDIQYCANFIGIISFSLSVIVCDFLNGIFFKQGIV